MIFEQDKKFDEARQKANVEICMELMRFFQKHEALRFGQGIVGLFGSNTDHLFNAEPQELLKIIKERNNDTT